ncbi:hypothetical protein ACVOMV_09600 [Mesorhizobium atlanticum]
MLSAATTDITSAPAPITNSTRRYRSASTLLMVSSDTTPITAGSEATDVAEWAIASM